MIIFLQIAPNVSLREQIRNATTLINYCYIWLKDAVQMEATV
jgi:hypothetical protein